MRNKVISQFGKYFIVIGIILGITVFNQSIEKQPLLADDNTEYVKAVVTESSSENLQTGTGEDFGSSQEVTLLIKSGSHKGEYVEAYSLNGYLYGANCTVGTKVIAQLSEYDGTLSASVYNYDREFEMAGLILVFLLTMWIVGGKKGINSITFQTPKT